MEVCSIHARTLGSTPERAGHLLDLLGSDDDPLWPGERWPAAMRMRFDAPLGVGAQGGHGRIPYSVDEYEPGRRVSFRFDPGCGLVGGHRFEVGTNGDGRVRLTHTLECRVEGSMRLLWPAVRQMHDAYLEDILDRAEEATTGQVAHPARQPWWIRAMNAVDMRRQRWLPSRRLARVADVAVPAVFAAVAAVHAAWALGWRWPGGSDQALAERVVGPGAQLPSAAMTWGVAILLAVAAGAVRLTAVSARQGARLATWLVAVVLAIRAAVFVPIDLFGGMDDIYERLDLAIYTPLCAVLAVGSAVVAQGSWVRSNQAVPDQAAQETS